MKIIDWSTFWSRIGAVSIRTKVMGIVAACIIGSAVALVWYTYHDDIARSREHLQQRGVTLCTGLAAQSRDLILTDNQFALYEMVKDALHADEDIVYIFVLDANGNVLVHTFEQGFPSDLLGKNQVQSFEPYRIQALKTEEGLIQDVAVPVLGGEAGIIRLGMSENNLNAEVIEHITRIVFWILLVIALTLVVAYGWADFLTKPISQLSMAARAIGKGDFSWRKPSWAKDEIGSLGTTFSEVSEELRRKEEMREQLLAKIISAQEDERKRIARELHDETGQALASIKVGLRYVEDSIDVAHVKEKTAELRGVAAQLLEDVHRLSVELRPNLLDDLGLVAAIERYAKEYATRMNINIDFHTSGSVPRHFPSEIEIAVFRIIQEALTNAAKYAEATNTSVVLRCRELSLVAVVEDDGKGFDINGVLSLPAEKRLGLFGMQERATLVGGKLTIESEPDAGTAIFLEVPLNLREGVDEKDKATSGR